jgi:iron-sulfur cluster repair protein YtfE (RIC family)
MPTISQYLTADHRHCDALMDAAERDAAAHRWDDAAESIHQFARCLGLHLAREEQVLFPAIEGVTGTDTGPTRMMRVEHESMLDLVSELQEAVGDRDGERLRGGIDTLLILLQQHNLKEERILYPLAEQLLGAGEEVVLAMQRVAAHRHAGVA